METQSRGARALEARLRGRGAVAAAELRAALGVSRATLSRLVRECPQVVRLGAARATHYGLAARIEGVADRLPVFEVDAGGAVSRRAELVPLDGGSWLEIEDGHAGPFEGLPPFVHEMAPAGYLGHRFARRHADLDLPASLQDWSDRHRLIAVARRGEDAAGNLVVGEEAMDRYLALEQKTTPRGDYPELAEATGRIGAGSSAAGEQPKFAAFDGRRHLLVKFTAGDGSDSELRWRDLFVCEALASVTLAANGVPAAPAEVVDRGSRRFLEIERFDRTATGRRGILSLGVIEDEYFGRRDNWSDAAGRFEEARMLSSEDRERIKLLEAFAILIANGDRHFGNVSFICDELRPQAGLELAPVYDMLPMDTAPSAGVLPDLPERLPKPRARHLDVWGQAESLAREFWERVHAESRITSSFRRMVESRMAA